MAEAPARMKLESVKEDPEDDVNSNVGTVGLPDPRQQVSLAATFPSYGFIGRNEKLMNFLKTKGTPQLWELCRKWEWVFTGPRSAYPHPQVLRADLEKHGLAPTYVNDLIQTSDNFKNKPPTTKQLKKAAAEERECNVFLPPNVPAKRDHIPKLPWGRHDVFDNVAYPYCPSEGPMMKPNNFMGTMPIVERYL